MMHTSDRRSPALTSAGDQDQPHPPAPPESDPRVQEERLGPRLEARTRRRRRRDTAAITAFVRGLNGTSGDGGAIA